MRARFGAGWRSGSGRDGGRHPPLPGVHAGGVGRRGGDGGGCDRGGAERPRARGHVNKKI